jgi:hypothetical protein
MKRSSGSEPSRGDVCACSTTLSDGCGDGVDRGGAQRLDGVKRKGRNRVSPPITIPRDDPNIDRAEIASITSGGNDLGHKIIVSLERQQKAGASIQRAGPGCLLCSCRTTAISLCKVCRANAFRS